MDVPTGADVRLWGPPNFDWAAVGYPAPAAPGDPDRLDKRVEWAAAEIESITGRPLSTIEPPTGAAPNLVPVAEKAITLKTLLDTLGGTRQALKVLGAPWLKAFTAGSYSETRFSPAELSGISGRGAEKLASLGPEPLPTLLLMLMTEDKRADWIYLLTGRAQPAGVFIEPDFGRRPEVAPVAWGPGVDHAWPWW